MNFKKMFSIFALLSVMIAMVSCETETVSEVDDLYGIDKDEIKEEDT